MKNNKITVREFNCSRDGLNIWGQEFIPADNGDKGLPAIIISHPFMVTATYVEHYARIMAQWGYATFIFDFCGGSNASRSDGPTAKMSVFTEAEDLKAVIDYVRNLSVINSREIFLMGCSQGGFVAAIVAAQLKEIVAGLIMFYPALCIPEFCRNGNMLGTRFNPNNIPEIINTWGMRIGRDYVESVMEMDVNDYISAYQGPVLITHGDRDSVVDLRFSVEANKYYPNSELVVIKGGQHGYSPKHDRIALEAVKEFLNKN